MNTVNRTSQEPQGMIHLKKGEEVLCLASCRTTVDRPVLISRSTTSNPTQFVDPVGQGLIQAGWSAVLDRTLFSISSPVELYGGVHKIK